MRITYELPIDEVRGLEDLLKLPTFEKIITSDSSDRITSHDDLKDLVSCVVALA